jgi:hypothetical protein
MILLFPILKYKKNRKISIILTLLILPWEAFQKAIPNRSYTDRSKVKCHEYRIFLINFKLKLFSNDHHRYLWKLKRATNNLHIYQNPAFIET